MIVGTGLDLTEVDRIRAVIERHGRRFLERLYTTAAIAYAERKAYRFERYAGRFAAKEAAMKAIGTGWRRGVGWRDFEVLERSRGLELRLSGVALRIAREERGFERAWLGASFNRTHAVAQVVLEGSSPR